MRFKNHVYNMRLIALKIFQEIEKFDIANRFFGPAKDFKELHSIRKQVRSAATGLVFGEDDGYISRWSFRAQQVSLRRLSGCDKSFQVPRTCTTDASVECFLIKLTM